MAKAEKLSVSIDKRELEWARAEARRSRKSLSAVLTDALRERRRLQAMDRLLKKFGADKIPDAVMEELRKELYGQ